jgi:molybdenum cofactor cytidylyltransferase
MVPDGARRYSPAVISAVVLAAGASTRFGRTKQLALLGGEPLVQHVVDAAAEAGIDEIVVVLGHEAEAVQAGMRLPPTGRLVVNARFAEGQSTSLGAGLRACHPCSEAAVVLLADQPGIRPEHVRALVAGFRDSGSEVVRLRFRDAPGPALLARRTWPEVSALSGDTGARALFSQHPERIRWVSVDEDAPRDIDLPEDLDRARTSERPGPW